MTPILNSDNRRIGHPVVVLHLKVLQHATTGGVHGAKRCLQHMQQSTQQGDFLLYLRNRI